MDYNETNLSIQRKLKQLATTMRTLTAEQLVEELKELIKVVKSSDKKNEK
jgi:hypothetical protein